MSQNTELYKKYRPKKWADIVGQDDVVRSLQNAVKNDTLPTAYGFFGSHGCGKALHKDTLIPTPHGFVTMGEIQVGDTVLGSDSQPTVVTDKYCPRDPKSVRITFDDGTVVKTSAGHLWTVWNPEKDDFNVVSSDDIIDKLPTETHPVYIKQRSYGNNNVNPYVNGYNDNADNSGDNSTVHPVSAYPNPELSFTYTSQDSIVSIIDNAVYSVTKAFAADSKVKEDIAHMHKALQQKNCYKSFSCNEYYDPIIRQAFRHVDNFLLYLYYNSESTHVQKYIGAHAMTNSDMNNCASTFTSLWRGDKSNNIYVTVKRAVCERNEHMFAKCIHLMRLLGGKVYTEKVNKGNSHNDDKIALVWENTPEFFANSVGNNTGSVFVSAAHDNVRDNTFCESFTYAETQATHKWTAHKIINARGVKDDPEDYFCISVDAPDSLFLCTESLIPTHNTSTAKILAKALNCDNRDASTVEPCGICESCVSVDSDSSLDVTYVSMANEGNVDNVRKLCDKATLQPHGNMAVFIFDEVHNLSKAAFDAMLIPLERDTMPSIMVLCSTEPEKIPKTVLSRIQTRNFSTISRKDMLGYVKDIADKEQAEIKDDVLKEVVRRGKGSARDTVSLLDTVIHDGDFSREVAQESTYAKALMRALFATTDNSKSLSDMLSIVADADGEVAMDALLEQVFSTVRKTIVSTTQKGKSSIGKRNNPLRVLHLFLVNCGEAIDKCARGDGTQERIYVEMAIAQTLLALDNTNRSSIVAERSDDIWG